MGLEWDLLVLVGVRPIVALLSSEFVRVEGRVDIYFHYGPAESQLVSEVEAATEVYIRVPSR